MFTVADVGIPVPIGAPIARQKVWAIWIACADVSAVPETGAETVTAMGAEVAVWPPLSVATAVRKKLPEGRLFQIRLYGDAEAVPISVPTATTGFPLPSYCAGA